MSRTYRRCADPQYCYHHPWWTHFLKTTSVQREFYLRRECWRTNGTILHHDGTWCGKEWKEAKWARRLLHKSARLRNRLAARRGDEVEREARTQGWVTR